MIGKKFNTLEEWTDFLKGKSVWIINEKHSHYRQKCKFVEMVGANNLILHPANKRGHAIRMKVRTLTGEDLFLIPGDFLIDHSSGPIQFSKNGK